MPEQKLLFYGVWFGGAVLAALIGWRQGRNPVTCFVAAAVATPVIALPVLLWLGKKPPEAIARDKAAAEARREEERRRDRDDDGL